MADEKPTLVLDMNGTLVCTSDVKRSVLDRLAAKESSSSGHYDDGVLEVRYSDSYTQALSIMKRPGLDEFLAEMAQVYEVIIFSHSEEPHVRTVSEFMDPGRKFVSQWYARDFCDGNSKAGSKDLRKLGKDLRRVVWVDDTPDAFGDAFVDNGIVVPTFSIHKCRARGVDPRKDGLLGELGPFLKDIATMEDLRTGIALWSTKKRKLEKSGWCSIM